MKYIGTKVVKAEPMTKDEAEKLLGRQLKPATDEINGYLVEYKDGYKSWSPKSVFEDAYKLAETPLNRMEIECVDLASKIAGCSKFLESDKSKDIDQFTRSMLSVQNSLMKEYYNVLCDRAKRMESGEGASNGFSFGVAIKYLSAGMAIRRSGWNGKGMFVVKQIPCDVNDDVIPNMLSLPQSAKDIIMGRENPHINYTNQMLIINPNGRADSWVPSSSDVFAEDWEIALN